MYQLKMLCFTVCSVIYLFYSSFAEVVFLVTFFFFFFFVHAHSMQKFSGQQSNLCHSGSPSHCSDNTRSLTNCTTSEFQLFFKFSWLESSNSCRRVLSSRNFCDDGNVTCRHCPAKQLLVAGILRAGVSSFYHIFLSYQMSRSFELIPSLVLDPVV